MKKNPALLTPLQRKNMEPLYRIEELCTSGWTLIDSNMKQLTKEQCMEKLQVYIDSGHNPNALRAVIDAN